MTWLILSVLLLALAFVSWRISRGQFAKLKAHANPDDTTQLSRSDFDDVKAIGWAGRVLAIGAVGGFVLLTALSTITVIPVGHVGVVTTFGKISSQKENGVAMVAPWSSVQLVSAQVQRKEFDHLTAFSKETQDVFVDATLNLSVSPTAIRHLYTTVGPDWYNKLIPSRVNQTLKDETVLYSTVEVAPNREKIRRDVRKRLEVQLAPYSIDVQDFLINNIDFDSNFKASIVRKQIATQNAQTAQNKVAQARYEADQVAATAEGDARATLVKATAQAKANTLLARSITPELVQFQAVQKLAPNVSTILLPSNSNLILPSSLTGGK